MNLYVALFFLIASQVMAFVLNRMICEATARYVDGLALATLCNIIALVFVYRFWDAITEGAMRAVGLGDLMRRFRRQYGRFICLRISLIKYHK